MKTVKRIKEIVGDLPIEKYKDDKEVKTLIKRIKKKFNKVTWGKIESDINKLRLQNTI